VIFVAKYVSVMGFGGSILGGARKIWGNPYLKQYDRTYCLINWNPLWKFLDLPLCWGFRCIFMVFSSISFKQQKVWGLIGNLPLYQFSASCYAQFTLWAWQYIGDIFHE